MSISIRWALAVLMLLSFTVSATEKDKNPPDKIVTYKKIGDTDLKLHLFTPEDHKVSDKRPAIIFFFGGGWRGGTPSQFFPHSRYLASRGMIAISAEYRVESRNKTTPRECVKDGKSAIRWIRQHARELGIDPERIASGGGSAGGMWRRPQAQPKESRKMERT